jgi:hypothetical protein
MFVTHQLVIFSKVPSFMQVLCIMLTLWTRTIYVHVIFLSDVCSYTRRNTQKCMYIYILNAGLKN